MKYPAVSNEASAEIRKCLCELMKSEKNLSVSVLRTLYTQCSYKEKLPYTSYLANISGKRFCGKRFCGFVFWKTLCLIIRLVKYINKCFSQGFFF